MDHDGGLLADASSIISYIRNLQTKKEEYQEKSHVPQLHGRTIGDFHEEIYRFQSCNILIFMLLVVFVCQFSIQPPKNCQQPKKSKKWQPIQNVQKSTADSMRRPEGPLPDSVFFMSSSKKQRADASRQLQEKKEQERMLHARILQPIGRAGFRLFRQTRSSRRLNRRRAFFSELADHRQAGCCIVWHL